MESPRRSKVRGIDRTGKNIGETISKKGGVRDVQCQLRRGFIKRIPGTSLVGRRGVAEKKGQRGEEEKKKHT